MLLVFALGTVLMRSAGCCINDVADRAFDKHVKRTADRPVTSGRIAPREALTVGAVLALLAFGLVLTTNLVAVLWSFVALAITLVYPYAKRYVAMPQAVLGLAFSVGIPMAFMAVQGGSGWDWLAAWPAVPGVAWVLVLANLAWVLAYDTEYAMVDRDDDLRIGLRTSAITLGRWDVGAVLLFYGVHLALMASVLQPLLGWGWWWLGWVVACTQVVWHAALIRDRSRDGCFKAFRANHWVGCALFCGLVLSMAVPLT